MVLQYVCGGERWKGGGGRGGGGECVSLACSCFILFTKKRSIFLTFFLSSLFCFSSSPSLAQTYTFCCSHSHTHVSTCRTNTNPNVQNMKKIADLYAEVIGILSQSRFHSVKRRFFLEIRDSQNNSSTVISIIEGMSFIRVKMFPVEELEQWFLFLQVVLRHLLN